MIDYQLGKIYKIVGNGKVYVGSTTRPLLCQRMAKHRSNYNMWMEGKDRDYITSFECISDPECYIELLESFPCNSKDELHKCERKWIESIICVNKVIPTRTQKEYYESYKERRKELDKENREKINQYQRVYLREYRARKKLLASNNGLAVLECNLSVKAES